MTANRWALLALAIGVAGGCSENTSGPPAGGKPPAPQSAAPQGQPAASPPQGTGADDDIGPFITSQRKNRVPKGYEAKLRIGEKDLVLAYSQIGVSGIKKDEDRMVQIEALPTGKAQPEDTETTLLLTWTVKGAKAARFDDLKGHLHEHTDGQEGLSAMLFTLQGKLLMFKKLKIALGTVNADSIEVSLDGTLDDGRGVTGTIKAYRGLWLLM